MKTDQQRDKTKRTEKALQEETRKVVRLRKLVDLTCLMLAAPSLSLFEACSLIHHAKEQALQLFPDKESTFGMLYRRRLARIVEERLGNSMTFLN